MLINDFSLLSLPYSCSCLVKMFRYKGTSKSWRKRCKSKTSFFFIYTNAWNRCIIFFLLHIFHEFFCFLKTWFFPSLNGRVTEWEIFSLLVYQPLNNHLLQGSAGWTKGSGTPGRCLTCVQGPKHVSILCYLPRHFSRELSQKPWSWDANQCSRRLRH